MKEKAPWDFIPKQGVSTDDVVGAAASGGTLTPRGQDTDTLTGDATLDNGPACEEPSANPECFLDAHPTRRDLLRTRLADRISNARENYKLALTNIKFETLLEKDEDLHWAASIAFELLAGRFLSFAQSALKLGRAGGIAALQDAELNTILAGEPASKLNSLARTAMSKVSEQGLDTASRLPFEQVKAGTLATVKAGKNQAATDSKVAKLGFVNHLKNQSGLAFDTFVGRAIASSDADMVVLFRAMHPNNHTEEMYTNSLKERIDEFMNSGVTKIGRSVFPQGKQNIERDIRVVYVRDMSGAITPWFQSQDGIEEIGSNLKTDFGPRFQNGPAKLRARVPDEFKEEAIARSEMIWGPIETIDDPNVAYMKSLGIDVLPAGSVFSSKASDNGLSHTGTQLPRGSVFE